MQLDASGRGYINILSATKLFHSPKLYSTFWFGCCLVSLKHFQRLGILKSQNWSSSLMKRISLFKDASKLFLEKVEQVVRLIRSKGCRDLLYYPKSSRPSRICFGTAWKSCSACTSSLYTQRNEGDQGCCPKFSSKSRFWYRNSDHRIRNRGSLGLSSMKRDSLVWLSVAYILSPQSSFDLLNESEQLVLITTSPSIKSMRRRLIENLPMKN